MSWFTRKKKNMKYWADKVWTLGRMHDVVMTSQDASGEGHSLAYCGTPEVAKQIADALTFQAAHVAMMTKVKEGGK